MSALSERIATAVVLDWVLRYTRDLDGTTARTRFDEVRSDLWEQEHEGAGSPAPLVAASMLLRALRGIPDDLGWRRERVAPGGVPAKVWIPLGSGDLFDQTNGTVTFGTDRPDGTDDADVDRLLARALVSNAASIGFGGRA